MFADDSEILHFWIQQFDYVYFWRHNTHIRRIVVHRRTQWPDHGGKTILGLRNVIIFGHCCGLHKCLTIFFYVRTCKLCSIQNLKQIVGPIIEILFWYCNVQHNHYHPYRQFHITYSTTRNHRSSSSLLRLAIRKMYYMWHIMTFDMKCHPLKTCKWDLVFVAYVL